ncbi:MAG: penicillin-binding protein [Bacteroidia bacterium]
MNVKRNILLRVYVAFFLMVLLSVAILVQIVKVQQVQGKYWKQQAQSLTTAFVNIDPIRGNIYAADGSLMATSLPIYDLRLDLNADALTDEVFYNNIDSLSWCLANYFKDRSAREYRNLLVNERNKGARYFLLKRDLNHIELKKVIKFPMFRLGRYRGGVIVEQNSQRKKPFQVLAARTLGFKVKDVRPVGLEGAYDHYLSGTAGKRLMQKVSGGIWIPINDENEMDPENGQDITTTIDINIQDVTESALLKQLLRYDAHHGCAIVMEVETGAIKAIANLAVDKDGKYGERYNYAIGESTEPGSTFKLASAMALLEHGYMKPTDTIHTFNGEVKFYDRTMRDASEEGGSGVMTLQEVFSKSSNVGISRAINKNYGSNPAKFIDFLNEVGLNDPVELQIAGEGKPVIKSPSDKSWSGTTLPWMSIGYEVRMTPVQMLTLYNAVANKGRMMKPYFVSEVTQVGNTVEKFDPVALKEKICSDQTLQQLLSMMTEVVDSGTAVNIRTSQYKIAGKTGTAQVLNEGSYRRTLKYQASFAGFFPADKPKYSCIVVISDPKDVYYGAWVAGPVFREIADKIYSNNIEIQTENNPEAIAQPSVQTMMRHGYEPDIKLIYENLQVPYRDRTVVDGWVKPEVKQEKVEWRRQLQKENEVPDVRGLALTDAVFLLENHGLDVGFSGSGKVVSQSVIPGTPIISRRKIDLTLN